MARNEVRTFVCINLSDASQDVQDRYHYFVLSLKLREVKSV